jgi:hypothetical protein
MIVNFYKKFFRIIYDKFVLMFFLLLFITALVFFVIANIFLPLKKMEIEKSKEKTFQERFLDVYNIIENNKKETGTADFLVDFFNLRK